MEDEGFVRNTSFGEHHLGQSASLVSDIAVADEDQSAFFAAERAFDAEPSTTTAAVLGQVQHLEIEADSRVVHELLPGQKCPSQNVGANGQPAAIRADALIQLCHVLGRSGFELVDEG